MIRAYDDNGNIVDLVAWEKQIRKDAIESAYYVIKPFMSIEEWTTEVNYQIRLKEQK